MIALDTSALSHFLRRPKSEPDAVALKVAQLIAEDQAILFGIVRQEVLSGIKTAEQFAKVELQTSILPTIYAVEIDHIQAARFFNACRANGIQGSAADFLVCAIATRLDVPILSTDPDFLRYQPILGLKLLAV
jgi:predicted nucleic acid-binding protein